MIHYIKKDVNKIVNWRAFPRIVRIWVDRCQSRFCMQIVRTRGIVTFPSKLSLNNSVIVIIKDLKRAPKMEVPR